MCVNRQYQQKKAQKDSFSFRLSYLEQQPQEQIFKDQTNEYNYQRLYSRRHHSQHHYQQKHKAKRIFPRCGLILLIFFSVIKGK